MYAQGHGQQPPSGGYVQQEPRMHQEEAPDEFYQDGVCMCSSTSGFARLDNWCMFAIGLGGFLMMVSLFIPNWRTDPHGTTELEKYWSFSGFQSRSYGIVHVKGSWSQSWTTLAQGTCDIRNLGQITGIAAAAIKFVSGGGSCSGSEACQQGFSANMHMRCMEYQTLMRVSMVTLAGTFLGCILIMAGTLVTSMSKRKKSGGIAFGLYLFAGVLGAIVNAVWALVSDNSFKNMSSTAWYPYPSLDFSFYIHTAGYCLVLIFNSIFGYLVLPDVWTYDPAQDKLDKKKAKLEKRLAKDHQYKAKKEELQGIINGGKPGNFPPPPGFAPGPAPRPYGQPQFPQPGAGQAYGQPQAYGQQAFGQPQAYGQQPAASQGGPQTFGLPPAAGEAPVQNTGFGLGAAVETPVQSTGFGLGAPGQLAQPAQPAQPAGRQTGSYNWPARGPDPDLAPAPALAPAPFQPQPPASSGGYQPQPQPQQQSLPLPQGAVGGFQDQQGPQRQATWNQMPGPPPSG